MESHSEIAATFAELRRLSLWEFRIRLLGKRDAPNDEKGAEIVGIFNPIESQQEKIFAARLGHIVQGRIAALGDHGDDALVGLGLGKPCKLIFRFEADLDSGGVGRVEDGLEARILTMAGDNDRLQAAVSGANSLFNRMQSVQQLHK